MIEWPIKSKYCLIIQEGQPTSKMLIVMILELVKKKKTTTLITCEELNDEVSQVEQQITIPT